LHHYLRKSVKPADQKKMIKVETEFGVITIDPATVSYYNVTVDLERKRYNVRFYFRESQNSINASITNSDEIIKIIRAIDFANLNKSFRRKN
jgi:hypothetical protein